MKYHIYSPYRICPVGAHVDHQHGLVTGFALNYGVNLRFDVTENESIELDSKNFDDHVSLNIAEETFVKTRQFG